MCFGSFGLLAGVGSFHVGSVVGELLCCPSCCNERSISIMRRESAVSWLNFLNVWMKYPGKCVDSDEETWFSSTQTSWSNATRLHLRDHPSQQQQHPEQGSSGSSISPRNPERPVTSVLPDVSARRRTGPQEVRLTQGPPAPHSALGATGPLQLLSGLPRTMSSSEQQPLLKNGTCTAPSEIRWDSHNGNTHIEIFSEHLLGSGTCNGGLSRRSEKNGDLLHHSDCLSSSSSSSSCSSSDVGVVISIPLPPPEKDDSRFPAEKWKAFIAFAFFQGMMIVNLTCLAVVHERVPKVAPLPDILFDILPRADWALDASEIIIIVSIWTTLLFIFIHKHRFIILRRVFLIIGLLYLMRSATMFVTQVPVASTTYYCSPKENSTSAALIIRRVARMFSGFGLSINGQHIYCGDYIFSGHTVVLTIAYLVISEYTPRRWFLFHWATWLSSTTGIFFVILSRGHYTIDVIIAYYVTTRVFWIYHTMANNQILKHPGPNNFLSRLWWFCLFSYFERNVGGVVPRQYEWPLPWPRRCLRRTRIS